MENLIDFPVSDDFRDFYYERGLTPFPSTRYHSKREEEIQRLHRQTYQQANTIQNQGKKLEDLEKKLARMEQKMFKTNKGDKEGGQWQLK